MESLKRTPVWDIIQEARGELVIYLANCFSDLCKILCYDNQRMGHITKSNQSQQYK